MKRQSIKTQLTDAAKRLVAAGLGGAFVGEASTYQRQNHRAKRWQVSGKGASGRWETLAEGDDLAETVEAAIARAKETAV